MFQATFSYNRYTNIIVIRGDNSVPYSKVTTQ